MELKQFARVLMRYWWLILIPTAITAVFAVPALLNRGGAAGGFTTTISYTAAQDMNAIPNRDGDFQDVWLASELAVNALTDWITSASFRDAVINQSLTGYGVIIEQPFNVAADNERSVGQIFLSTTDGDELTTIANAAIDVLRVQNAAAFPQMGGVPASVTVLNPPVIVAAPPPLTDRFGPLIRVGLGLLLGVGLAFLAHYLDPMLRRRDDVEALGLTVVGSIPTQR